MYLFLKEVAVCIIYVSVVSYGYPATSNIGSVMYIHESDYLQESDGDTTVDLKKPDMESVLEVLESVVKRELRDFQNFFGRDKTGSQEKFVNPVSEDEDEGTSKLSDNNVPDLCKNSTFDTIIRGRNGVTYIFKGDFYWKYLSIDLAYGYPRKISEDWDGLEGNLDASFTLPDDTRFFFKGNRYWRFTNKKMDNGYPKVIGHEEFKGIPGNLDAALVWTGNQKLYFFKGDKYWRYDFDSYPPVKNNYPAPIQGNWDGIPLDGINGAVWWDNSVSYFFKGDKYYRFDDNPPKVTQDSNIPFPRSTANWWFNC